MSAVDGKPAPGGPGLEPRWTSSAKSGVGTAFDQRSLVWFTISFGIVDEVYYPRVDQANTRDFGLLVTAADGAPPLFSEEKRDTRSVVHLLAPGVPGYRLVNTCADGRYEIEKVVITDPERDVLLQRVRFRPLEGAVEDYRVFALVAPHIGNQGYGNDGWRGEYKGVPMLFAQRNSIAMALASNTAWRGRSIGYVGVNDGWHQVREYGHLRDEFTLARDGNVALTGEIDLASCIRSVDGARVAEFVLALAFGTGAAEAAHRARMSLASDFDRIVDAYVKGWRGFHDRTVGPRLGAHTTKPDEMRVAAKDELASKADESTRATANGGQDGPRDRAPVQLPQSVLDLFWSSAATVAVHEDKRALGALIASLSIPWGQSKGDHELGGYHLVWPRDLVESAGGLLAAGHPHLARRSLRYLMSTQEADGSWPQNMWLDGTPYWRGMQLDEVALPILFAELLKREGELADLDPWPMTRKAAGFILRHGPVTEQDRWEEDSGYSPFTLAAQVAALIVAADCAEQAGDGVSAQVLRDTADAWNENIERWTYVRETEFARLAGVDGYYARIGPSELIDRDPTSPSVSPYVDVRNRPAGMERVPYENLVSPDALALVRFGLRDANDPRITNTVRVIDALLRNRTSTGPVWHRYNNDGYGEHEDGAPFDGTGIGRGWPLLAGERAHYELARGRAKAATRLLGVMRAQASDGGMIPEQVWDTADVPERELCNGRPTGGAMPLVWAHAEYLKLVRSLMDGRVFDMPDAAYRRYVRDKVTGLYAIWSTGSRIRSMLYGRVLRIQTDASVLVHWSTDNWRTREDTASRAIPGLGIRLSDLDTSALPPRAEVVFTLYYPDAQRWEGRDYRVVIEA